MICKKVFYYFGFIILKIGTVTMNESMLTGESIPIIKSSIPFSKEEFSFEKSKNHILFEGTKVLQTNAKNEVLIVAVRTGFSSLKGQLVRTILFPKRFKHDLFLEIAKFLIFFGVVAFIFFFSSLSIMIKNNFKTKNILLRLGDYIIWTVPPGSIAFLYE